MTKLRVMEASSQAPSAARGERITIGVDLARTKYAHAVHWGARVQRQLVTPGGLEHVQALVREYHPAHAVRLVYEACGFGYELAWWAQAEGIEVIVVAPSRVERVPGTRVKTDRLDARTLATKGRRDSSRRWPFRPARSTNSGKCCAPTCRRCAIAAAPRHGCAACVRSTAATARCRAVGGAPTNAGSQPRRCRRQWRRP